MRSGQAGDGATTGALAVAVEDLEQARRVIGAVAARHPSVGLEVVAAQPLRVREADALRIEAALHAGLVWSSVATSTETS